MQDWDFNLKSRVKYYELRPDYEKKARIENKKVIIQFDDILPSFAMETRLLYLYMHKMKDVTEEKMVAFVSSFKKMKTGSLNKPIVFFKEFFFTGGDTKTVFNQEFIMLAYNKNQEQCEFERDNYIQERNTALPIINADNIESVEDDKKKRNFINLSLLDMVYLQNFRIFMKVDNKEEHLDFRLLYPHLNFCLQEISWNFKYCSVGLSQKLLGKKDNELSCKSFGFLTMDSNSRILPLQYDDLDHVFQYPLVGVWIYGEDLSQENLENNKRIQMRVWGVLTHFLKHFKIKCRFSFIKKKTDFLLLSFNKNSQPKMFSTKIVDRSEMDKEITVDHFRVDINDENYIRTFKDKQNKDAPFFLFDFSQIERDYSQYNLLKINRPSSYLSKKSQILAFSDKNERNMSNSQTIGVQTDQKILDDSDFSVLNHIKTHQEKTEGFYRKTIEGMQTQINMLSQALISINQNLAILNQQIVSSNNQVPLFNNYQNSFQNERASNDTSKGFIFPDVTTKSLSISSNTLNMTDQTPRISKTYSEAQSEIKETKPERFTANDSEILHKKRHSINDEKSFISTNNILPKNNSQPVPEEPESRLIKEPKEVFDVDDYNKLENNEETDKNEEQDKISVPKQDIVKELNKINEEGEFNINDNNKSIPLPRIHAKFQNLPSSDSDSSDNDDDEFFRTTTKKYLE